MTDLKYNIKNKIMKPYTDLEQSKKLAGILPIGSNDMYYEPSAGFNTHPSEVRIGDIKYAHQVCTSIKHTMLESCCIA